MSGIPMYLPPGLEKQIDTPDSEGNFPRDIGTIAMDSCGHLFAYVKAGAADLAVGKVVARILTPADVDADLVIPAAVAVGATSIVVTLGATTAYTVDELKGGYIHVNDADGEGQRWRIRGNTAAAVTVDMTVYLEDTDSVKVALTTSSEVGLQKNVYFAVETFDGDDIDGPALGVPLVTITTLLAGWIQLTGPVSVLTQGTIVVGKAVCSSLTVDGAVMPPTLTEAGPNTGFDQPHIGTVLLVGGDGEYSLINLNLPVFS